VKLQLKLFAVAKQVVGQERLEIELPAGSTVADLRRTLAAGFPALAPYLPGCAFAVNRAYAANHMPLPPDAEVACLPPVSGG